MADFLPYLINGFFIFIVVWWLVIFTVLPQGVQREDNPEAGHSTGAPKKTDLKRKIKRTTLIAFVITVLIMLALNTGLITLPAA